MALAPGTRLGVYDVTALLGSGGMGEVWRAHDSQLQRDVALKILPDAFAADPDRLARFQREAQVLASLNHPGIAAIYGIEEAEPSPPEDERRGFSPATVKALVLELVEGPTLADRITQGPMPLDEALPIAKQIAEALEAAHEQGIIHRDLKPANVKVKADGTVKVLDFGLAKALQPESAGDASESPTVTVAATATGVIIGTAAYMSPEQATARPVDKRADVWAFGAVLYEMLTGQRAFVGDDASDTLAAVLRGEVDFDRLPDATPARLQQVLRACLQRDPKQRVHDVADVRLAMEGVFETTINARTESAVESPLQLWQRPLPAAGVVLAVAAIASLAVWNLTRPAPGRLARFPIPLAADQSFSSTDRPAVAISPDGTRIVYVANGGLWLRPVDQLQATAVPGTEGAQTPFFSPDSQSLGFWADGELKRVAVSGGAPVTFADVANEPPDGANWGADGMILYGAGSVMRVAGANGIPEVVIPLEDPEAGHGPQMLPGDEWVLYTLRSGGAGSWNAAEIVVQSVTTGERTVLLGGRDARYLSTGHLVYALDNVILAVPFDVASREVTGGPVPLVEDVSQAGSTGGAAQFSVSTDGTLVYVPGVERERGLSLTWITGTGEESLTAAPVRDYANIRVSPDGTRVAADLGDGSQRDVWIWRLDQGPLTRLTRDAVNDRAPLWTPDSSRVVFSSARDGGGLFWEAADGTGEVERLLQRPAVASGWSADGRLVVSRAGDIGVLTVEGEPTVEMLIETESTERFPALSADGRWLAYESDESGQVEIFVQPFPNVDDGKWQVSTDTGFHPVWSPDGRHLFYVVGTNRMMVVEVETDPTFNPGTPMEAFGGPNYELGGGQLNRGYDIGPDGERFLVRTREGTGAPGDAAFNGMIVVENWFEELTERVPVP